MDKNEPIRTEIENRIIAKLREIQTPEKAREGIYVDFDRMDELLDECNSIIMYFQENSDTTVDVEIVRVYADLTRYFRQLIARTTEPEIRNQSKRWLDEIEGWIDDLISAAARNWANIHSADQ